MISMRWESRKSSFLFFLFSSSFQLIYFYDHDDDLGTCCLRLGEFGGRKWFVLFYTTIGLSVVGFALREVVS